MLARDWHILSILRAQNEHRLPAVLSVEEVRSILAQVKNFPHHVFLSTVYSCGLRLDEARHLEVSDIDSQRMRVHVHRGKGAKDRYVALPEYLQRYLAPTAYDCVVIGARCPPGARRLALFEAVINAVHKTAPGAAIALRLNSGQAFCFNEEPTP